METQQQPAMTFGGRVRELRKAKGMTLRDVAKMVGINFTYLSKIENGKLDFSAYPSEKLIRKLGKALAADEDELMLLACKVPDSIKRKVIERPDLFRKIAMLGADGLEIVARAVDELLGASGAGRSRRRAAATTRQPASG